MSERKCKNCKWFKENGIMPDGFCYRYPESIHIQSCAFHWCGEFKERDAE